MNEKDYYKIIGELVRKLRTQAKMTQNEVAEKSGVYRTDLSAFENRGEKIRAADKIDAILKVFGYTLASTEKKTTEIFA